jgi:hypothetical protein
VRASSPLGLSGGGRLGADVDYIHAKATRRNFDGDGVLSTPVDEFSRIDARLAFEVYPFAVGHLSKIGRRVMLRS